MTVAPVAPWQEQQPHMPNMQQHVATPPHPAQMEAPTDSWAPMLHAITNLAQQIAGTEFVPQSLRGSVPKVVAAIAFGREIGLPPMTALGSIHVINGKAGMSAEAMRALILSAGHEFRVVSMDETRVVVKARRRGDDDWQQFSYSMTEAVKAGDAKKNPNYTTRPADMLLARATGRCAKAMFPDVVRGLGSTEELSTADDDTTEAPAVAPKAAPAVAQEQSATIGRKPRAARKAPTAPQGSAPERRRAPLPKPRGGEVVDAITGEVDTLPEPEALPTGDHRKAVQAAVMHWDRLGVKDRAERIWYTGVILGKAEGEIASTNDLTLDEVRTLVAALEKAKDLDVINDTYLPEAEVVEDGGGDA